MPLTGSNSTYGSPIGYFLKSVGYPLQASFDAQSFVLDADGMEVKAEDMDGRIVLSFDLARDGFFSPVFAEYAAGRILKEDATLSFGDGRLFLWQDAPAGADASAMRRLLETFLDSCEWWRERADGLRGGETAAGGVDEIMMIRP